MGATREVFEQPHLSLRPHVHNIPRTMRSSGGANEAATVAALYAEYLSTTKILPRNPAGPGANRQWAGIFKTDRKAEPDSHGHLSSLISQSRPRTNFKRFRSSKHALTDSDDSSRRPSGSSEATTVGLSSPAQTFALQRGRSDDGLAVQSKAGSASLRSISPTPAASSLGLHVLHQPELCAIDIVFVHGLAGHSRKTWTKGGHDPALFWPENWLPFEPDMSTARISTFGYDAAWKGSAKSISTITDFAKELLYELRFAKDQQGAELNMGERPIIFVVHSMGGLVVKKAYLMGLHDENYKHIISSVSAIIFLSTPHRGTNLAETLNSIIAATLQSSKSFISDLNKSSFALEELNEQFRHVAPELSIWSFYETLATAIGPKKIMVLEKDSSILGYPSEISRPMRADHQNICKYSSPSDTNYISIKNAIKSLVALFRSQAEKQERAGQVEMTMNLKEIFQNSITSEDDYNSLRRRWMPDTCQWFLGNPAVMSWVEPSHEPSVLWYNAPPASGKSVLSAFVINHLREMRQPCQYFFFRYSDQAKMSAASAMKAIAFQLAKDVPECTKRLQSLPVESLGINSEDPILIWRNLVQKLLVGTAAGNTLWWVIDGLDECNAPKEFLDCLKGLENTSVPVKVLFLSRNTNSTSLAFDRLSRSIPVTRLEMDGQSHNLGDIQAFIDQEMDHIRGSSEFKEQLRRNIMSRCGGNFLWTKLVLDDIMECHTEESIQEALDELSDDMYELYERMERNLVQSTRKSNLPLIRALLEWTTCSHRALTLEEMSQALQPEFSRILDLKRTIKDTCGQFIQIDSRGRLSILHNTAKEYFTKDSKSQLFINEKKVHGKLFLKAVSSLEAPSLRWDLIQHQRTLQSTEPFLFYCAISWPYHLGQSHGESAAPEYMDRLVAFFRSPAILAWIHALSLMGRIDVLIKASKVLSSFVKSTRKRESSRNPMMQRIAELELLDSWSVDLTKLVGKFGRYLIAEPGVIYDIVPALSPGRTTISELCYDSTSSNIQVVGNQDTRWNDNLSRIALPQEGQAWGISCASKLVAVMMSTGRVQLLSSSNFIEVSSVDHGEPVTAMALNDNGSKLVTYGLKQTKVWTIPSGELLFSTPNPMYTKAISIVFADDDSKLLMGGDDNTVRYALCHGESSDGWQVLNPALLKESATLDGTVINSPMCLAFSGDQKYVGVSYRGAPLSVWRLSDGRCINKCRRAKDARLNDRRPSTGWFAVDRFTWNPVTGHILGIYKDGCVFKWHPLTDEVAEVQKPADEIAASPDGKLFVTSSSDGSVRVWNFAHLSVIYQLSSDDLVTGLQFSPDSRRFYDLRSGVVNAWEPNCVARFSEYEAHLSDSNSDSRSSEALSRFSEERVAAFEAVTAVAVAPDSSAYIAGFEDGTILLYDTEGSSEGAEFASFYNFCDVTHIVWSPDGHYVAMADLAGDIQVMTVEQGKDKTVALPQPQVQLDSDNITQLLFGPGRLLVLTHYRGFLCSLVDGAVMASQTIHDQEHLKWLVHPNGALLACNAQGVQEHSWESLEPVGHIPLLQSQPEDSVPATLSSATICQDSLHFLFDIKTSSGERAILLSDVEDWPASVDKLTSTMATTHISSLEPRSSPLQSQALPSRLTDHIYKPLGMFSGSRFAFIDQDMWFSVYNVGVPDPPELYQRYYFIPQDWIGTRGLQNCVLTTHAGGTLFLSKDDRVVRIKCGLDFARPFSVI